MQSNRIFLGEELLRVFCKARFASEDMSQFLKDVSETATENDVHIFSQYKKTVNT